MTRICFKNLLFELQFVLFTCSVLASSLASPITPAPYSSPAYPSAHPSQAYPSPAHHAAYPSPAYPAHNAHKYQEEYPEVPAKYNFAYEVADAYSGDYKTQTEDRDGDYVKVTSLFFKVPRPPSPSPKKI